MANVRAHVLLKARVSVINDTSGPKEGDQWHNIHKCVTQVITLDDWNWRYETAKQILCAGITDNGQYYGEVVGDIYL